MSANFDVIIIGAGHNGLVCANRLSVKGKKVLILEANQDVGGLACSREFAPGFKVSAVAHLLYGLHPQVYKYCDELSELEFSATNLTTIVTNESKDYISFKSGSGAKIITGSSSAQDKSWDVFNDEMNSFSKVLLGLADKLPPRLKHAGVQDYKTLLYAGFGLRKLGRQGMRQFLRIIPMNVYDLVEESFTCELLKAAVCFEAILGTRLGPRAPNTVYNWLNRRSIMNHSGGLSLATGGMGAITQALSKSAVSKGAQIKTNSRVVKILVSNNRVSGVSLDNGETFLADKVISNADINQTLLSLVGTQHLDTEIVRRVLHIPMQGSTAKMHLALNQLPESITGNLDDLSARLIYAPSPNVIERASNAIKYGEYAEQPVFEVTIATLNDNSLAPHGKHVMSVLIPYVPYQHKNGWEQQKKQFEAHMLDHIEQLFPGINSTISAVETLTPFDIEQQFNLTGGHWHHGEIGLERFLVLRPIPGYAQYTTPIEGLYLCGADCHPGGDVNGAAGLNAAQAVLKSNAS